MAYGDGMALVYKKAGGIEAVQHLYGIMDTKGNWLWPLSDWNTSGPKTGGNAYFGDSGAYWGEGVFALHTGVLFHTKDGTLIYTKHDDKFLYRNLLKTNYFEDGITLLETLNHDDWHISSSPDTLKDSKNSHDSAVLLRSDGTVEEIDSFDYCFGSLAVRRADRHLEITDYSAGTTNIFSDFSQEHIQKISYSNGYLLLDIVGADRERYFSVLDRQGVQQFEPIKVNRAQIGDFVFSEGKIIFSDSSTTCGIVDCKGNYLARNLQYIIRGGVASGLILTSQEGKTLYTATSLAYIDVNGNEVITEVAES